MHRDVRISGSRVVEAEVVPGLSEEPLRPDGPPTADASTQESYRQLRESEALARALIETYAQSTWETDAEGRVIADSPSWREYTGESLEDWLQFGWTHAVHPEDRDAVLQRWNEAVQARRLVNLEFRICHAASAGYRWTNLRATPFCSADGSIEKWIALTVDIDARKRTEAALCESEARFRLFVENVREYALVQTDRQGLITSWSPGAERLFQYTSAEMAGKTVEWLLTPEDRVAGTTAAELARVLKGERVENVRWLQRKDGSLFWVQWVCEPLYADDGTVLGAVKVLRDETERMETETRRELLFSELNHRVKNTLALIGAIARQTLRGNPDPRIFAEKFGARLQAVAAAHGVLTRRRWESAEVSEVIREQFEMEGDSDRIQADGPVVLLPANAGLSLMLVLHELGTNTRKYGALSVASGRLAISWGVASSAGENVLFLDWVETGGPPPQTPIRPGFGTSLIEKSLAGVGGCARLGFNPGGLHCHIELSLRTYAPAMGVISHEKQTRARDR